jgi:hypothetical protein
MHIVRADFVYEIEDVTTYPARFAVPASCFGRVLERGPTLASVPWAATHSLRLFSASFLPAVFVEYLMFKDEIS